jgi:hypothetical protein
MRTCGGLSLLLIFGLHLPSQAAPVEPTEKCGIEGTVVAAASGAPLGGAEVSVEREGASEPPIAVSTDAAGHYAVDDVEPGRYSLYVQRNGYVPQQYGRRGTYARGVTLILEPGKKLRGIDFRLIATGVIAGRVLGKDNLPRVRANVEACTPRYKEGERGLVAAGANNTTTNDLGEYRIYGLAPARYYVEVSGQGPDQVPIKQPEGAPPEERYLPTLYPNVTDLDHAAMVDVQAGGEAQGIDIAALKSRTFHVRGKILGLDATAQDARVRLYAVGRLCETGRGADQAPDARGNFDFGGVTPGPYVVSIRFFQGGRLSSASRPIRVVDADVHDVNLAPSTGTELPGHVRVEGGKRIQLNQCRVGLWNPYTPTEPMAQVNSDGSFVLQLVGHYAYRIGIGPLPEDFYIKSVRLDDLQITGTTVDLGSAEGSPGVLEIVVSGTAGAIDGIVKNEKDDPASGAVVVLVPDSNHRQESDLFKDVPTDNNGRFMLRGIRPGDYKLFAWDDVEPGIWWDPEFLSHYETKGENVKVEANGHLSVNLRLISVSPE